MFNKERKNETEKERMNEIKERKQAKTNKQIHFLLLGTVLLYVTEYSYSLCLLERMFINECTCLCGFYSLSLSLSSVASLSLSLFQKFYLVFRISKPGSGVNQKQTNRQTNKQRTISKQKQQQQPKRKR